MARTAAKTKKATTKTAAKPAAKPARARKAAKSTTTKSRSATAKKAKAKTATESVSDEEVKIDRRRAADRRAEGESAAAPAAPAKLERRKKVNRRRQIDPTTCERDYSDSEVEFMNALDEYKRKNGRMFPTCSEVLEVVRELGYVRLTPAEAAARKAEQAFAQETVDDAQAEHEAEEALALSDEVRVGEQ